MIRASFRQPGRKLLVASLGVAAVSYVNCGTTETSPSGTSDGGAKDAALVKDGRTSDVHSSASAIVGNLMAEPIDAQMVVGNLMAVPVDAAPHDAPMEAQMIVGNLVAPPIDASPDGQGN